MTTVCEGSSGGRTTAAVAASRTEEFRPRCRPRMGDDRAEPWARCLSYCLPLRSNTSMYAVGCLFALYFVLRGWLGSVSSRSRVLCCNMVLLWCFTCTCSACDAKVETFLLCVCLCACLCGYLALDLLSVAHAADCTGRGIRYELLSSASALCVRVCSVFNLCHALMKYGTNIEYRYT